MISQYNATLHGLHSSKHRSVLNHDLSRNCDDRLKKGGFLNMKATIVTGRRVCSSCSKSATVVYNGIRASCGIIFLKMVLLCPYEIRRFFFPHAAHNPYRPVRAVCDWGTMLHIIFGTRSQKTPAIIAHHFFSFKRLVKTHLMSNIINTSQKESPHYFRCQ